MLVGIIPSSATTELARSSTISFNELWQRDDCRRRAQYLAVSGTTEPRFVGSLADTDGMEDGARTHWQQWLARPEKLWLWRCAFQVHFWVGAALAGYVLLISVSGSLIVFRNELPTSRSIEWLVRLHENLLSGTRGRVLDGVGAIGVLLLCLTGAVIWWPGIAHWRRSLSVDWHAHFARINWDLHSALGFWCFTFVMVWAISGIYFSFPSAFDVLWRIDPRDRFTDQTLSSLSQLHFGRFGSMAEIVWTIAGLVPGILAFTGMFICCRRVIFKKPSNPRAGTGGQL